MVVPKAYHHNSLKLELVKQFIKLAFIAASLVVIELKWVIIECIKVVVIESNEVIVIVSNEVIIEESKVVVIREFG